MISLLAARTASSANTAGSMPSFAKPRSTTPRLFVWSVWSCVMRTASRFAGSNPASSQRAKKSRLQMPQSTSTPLPVAVSSTTAALPRLPLASTCNASRWFIGFASRISSRCLSRPPIVPECAPLAPRIPKRSRSKRGVPNGTVPAGFYLSKSRRARAELPPIENQRFPAPPVSPTMVPHTNMQVEPRGTGASWHQLSQHFWSARISRSLSNATPSTRCRPWRRVCSLRFSSAPS